jgi:hypothetical protein
MVTQIERYSTAELAGIEKKPTVEIGDVVRFVSSHIRKFERTRAQAAKALGRELAARVGRVKNIEALRMHRTKGGRGGIYRAKWYTYIEVYVEWSDGFEGWYPTEILEKVQPRREKRT